MTTATSISFLSDIPTETLRESGVYGRTYALQLALERTQRQLENAIHWIYEQHAEANRNRGIGSLTQPEDLVNADPDILRLRAEVAELMTQVKTARAEIGGIVFLPARENLDKIEKKLAAYNRKATTIGTEPITLKITDEKLLLNYKISDDDHRGYDFGHVFCVLSGATPKIPGYEFLASITPTEEGNLVKRIPAIRYAITHNLQIDADSTQQALDAIDLSRFHSTGAICEHCNTIRSRKDCYVIYNDTTGESLQVGRTCLRDYLGSNNPEAVLKALEMYRELIATAGERGNAEVIATTDFLIHCAAVLRASEDPYQLGRHGATNVWHYKRQNKDRQGQPMWVEPITADETAAKAVLHWVRNEWTEDSEFARNVKIALASSYVEDRAYGLAGAVFVARSRWLKDEEIRIRRAAEQADDSPVVEGRIVITGEVVKAAWHLNKFSYDDEQILKLTVRDDRGFKVWGTCPREISGEVERGSRITFTATVEKSDDDQNFGFYRRPTKPAILKEANA